MIISSQVVQQTVARCRERHCRQAKSLDTLRCKIDMIGLGSARYYWPVRIQCEPAVTQRQISKEPHGSMAKCSSNGIAKRQCNLRNHHVG